MPPQYMMNICIAVFMFLLEMDLHSNNSNFDQ